MIYEHKPSGEARISGFLSTRPALRYLNCCKFAGWHCCNQLYHLQYEAGVPFAFLLYTIEGSGRLRADGKEYALSPESLILIAPNTPMAYETEPKCGTWSFYWLNLEGERVHAMANKLKADGHVFFAHMPDAAPSFRALLEDPLSEEGRSQYVEAIFRLILSRAVFGSDSAAGAENMADRILAYIAAHYAEPLRLEQLSRRFFLSQNQVIRLAEARCGYTPHEYLLRYRLAKACELLQYTQLPIGEIGSRTGFTNHSHFAARFKALYGLSPGAYRKFFGGTAP